MKLLHEMKFKVGIIEHFNRLNALFNEKGKREITKITIVDNIACVSYHDDFFNWCACFRPTNMCYKDADAYIVEMIPNTCVHVPR